MVNIRQDPFERTPSIGGETLNDLGGGYMNDFYAREFWRFVLVQQQVAKLAKTAIDYPPMQDPASFNLDAVKKQIEDDDQGPRRAVARAGSGGRGWRPPVCGWPRCARERCMLSRSMTVWKRLAHTVVSLAWLCVLAGCSKSGAGERGRG